MPDSSRLQSLLTALLLPALLLVAWPAVAQTREDARLITATQVMQELRSTPDQDVPGWLMERAYGVAVIPEVLRAGLIFAGRHGNGVMTVRDDSGRFSNPAFISLTGGSVGWQVGAQSTDVVLVFATRRSVENFARGKFILGATAAVAAGPVGRAGEAAAGKDAEIYSYSRNRGLFAGVALDGTALLFEPKATRNFYGKDLSANDIFSGKSATQSESARRFIASVVASLPANAAGANGAAAGTSAAPRATPPANGAASGAANEAAKTFPLEDRKPGGEPQ
jgi:lipid-binding SYLF domain-containing protein